MLKTFWADRAPACTIHIWDQELVEWNESALQTKGDAARFISRATNTPRSRQRDVIQLNVAFSDFDIEPETYAQNIVSSGSLCQIELTVGSVNPECRRHARATSCRCDAHTYGYK